MYDDYLFHAETPSGYIIKTLIEVLQNCLSNEASFYISNSNGLSLCSPDNKMTTLIYLNLKRENFDKFYCDKDMTISVPLKHINKFIKNIKKKDSITLFIKKNHPTKLGIHIIPTSLNKESDKSETSYVSISEVATPEFDLPEGYHLPKIIPSTEYQKMCKKLSSLPSKIINIKIQYDRYISFFCEGGEILSSEMSFGSLDNTLDYNGKQYYENDFNVSQLSQLIKLPGLSNRMKIFSPIDETFPIKISMQAGTLGYVDIFIKNKNQIHYEENKRQQESV